MGPPLLVDKSVIHGFSHRHISILYQYYTPVITPILINEILGDLSKDKDSEKAKAIVASLAARTHGIRSWVVPDARELTLASLMGQNIPLNGQIPTFEGESVITKRGTIGHVMDEPFEQKILRRWRHGDFNLDEVELARYIRKEAVKDFKPLQKVFRENSKGKRFDSLEEMVLWVDEQEIAMKSDETKIRYLFNVIDVNPSLQNEILNKWNASKCSFSEYAPYAFYFYRTITICSIGIASETLSSGKDSKTHFDIEYLLYLPFSKVFASGDRRVHEPLSKFLLRQDQNFLYKDDLQKDLKAIEAYQELSQDQTTPEIKDKLTLALWTDDKDRKKQPPIPKEVQTKALKDIQDLFDGSIKLRDRKRLKDTPHNKALRELSLVDRNYILMDLVEFALGLKQGLDTQEIRESFDENNVRDFYDAYADLWSPDIDYLSLLTVSNVGTSAILYTDFSPEALGRTLQSLVLYFDHIFIPDPVHTPWNMKEECNPIANPDQFVEDTFKILNGILFSFPLMMMKRLSYVPDPMDFDPEIRKVLIQSAKKRFSDVSVGPRDKKRFENTMKTTFFSTLSRLPENTLKNYVKRSHPSLSGRKLDDFVKYMKKKNADNPLHLKNRDFSKNGDLICMRSGGNLEQMLMLSEILRAFSVSESDTRMTEIQLLSNENSKYHKKISFSLPMFLTNDSYFLEVLRDEEIFKKARTLLSKLSAWKFSINCTEINDDLVKEIFDCARQLEEIVPEIEADVQKMNESEQDSFVLQSHGLLNISVRTYNELGDQLNKQNRNLLNADDSLPKIGCFCEITLRPSYEQKSWEVLT